MDAVWVLKRIFDYRDITQKNGGSGNLGRSIEVAYKSSLVIYFVLRNNYIGLIYIECFIYDTCIGIIF